MYLFFVEPNSNINIDRVGCMNTLHYGNGDGNDVLQS